MEICVFGAASMIIDESYLSAVEEMGEFLAKRGNNLVYGAGCTGSMGAAARGFKKGGGVIHGVVPKFFEEEELKKYVNWECDKITLTDTMNNRKEVMEAESDAFIICPGGIGTYEEFFEILTLKHLGRHRKPIAVYNVNGFFSLMDEVITKSINEGFVNEKCRALFKVFDNLDDMIDYIENDDMQGLTLKDMK